MLMRTGAWRIDRQEAEKDRTEDRRRAAIAEAVQNDAAERAQTNKVTAWFTEYDPAGPQYPGSPHAVTNIRTWGAAVRNASDLPVFDIRVFYYRVHDPRDCNPWTGEPVYASVDIIWVIPPGQLRNQELPDRVSGQHGACNEQDYVVAAEFTDANGVRWFRDERAALQPR